MTAWLAVVIIAAVVLGSGVIGAVIGERRARRDADDWPEPLVPSSFRERRAAVYFDVAIGWHAYVESVRPLAFPGEGAVSDRPRDLAAVLRSRAQLEQFGTIQAQRMHDDALESAVTLIDVLRSLPKSPTSGAPDLGAGRQTLRVVLRDLANKVDQLEWQMQGELHTGESPVSPLFPPAPPPIDSHVEITGRAGAPRLPVVAGPPRAAPRR